MNDLITITRAQLQEIKAEAWDLGHATRQIRELDDCRCGAYYEGECGCGKYGTGRLITPNPYRDGEVRG